jgi:pimeloyl-ACP methyl ester carboxylesterase
MTNYVLVHGAFHGGWCWRDVATRLRDAGHTVFTPTLTGLGERSHLATSEVDLETHIADIVGVFDWEDLSNAVLVGHSYGGVPITGAGDRLADRISALVYLDAVIPEDGMALIDYQPTKRRQAFVDSVAAGNGWQIPQPAAAVYDVHDVDLAAWVDSKCMAHPWATFNQAVRLSGAIEGIDRRVCIRCTATQLPYLNQFSDGLKESPGWEVVYLDAGHDCMVTVPDETTGLLLDFA